MSDLISRSELIAKIKPPVEGEYATLVSLASVRKMLLNFANSVPSVDAVEVVHGEWEHFESGWPEFDMWRCTSCGDEWIFEYDPTDKETMVNYCPNCGADMRERNGDDEP